MTYKLLSVISTLILLFVPLLGYGNPHPQSKLICEVTAQKSQEWSNYDVTIAMKTVPAAEKEAVIATFHLSKATTEKPSINSQTQSFDCEKYKQFHFVATYTPPIWRNAQGEPLANIFRSVQVWDITPQVMNPQSGAYKITIHLRFPEDFGVKQEVPKVK